MRCVAAGCNGTTSVDIYTIATNTWAAGPNYPQFVGLTSGVALGGFIYVAGGDNGTSASNKTYRLDPSTGVWDDASIADLPAGREETTGDLLNGHWLVAGIPPFDCEDELCLTLSDFGPCDPLLPCVCTVLPCSPLRPC